MLILGSYAVWREIEVPGAKPVRLRIEALDDEALDEIAADLGAPPPAEDAEGRAAWWNLYGAAVARRSVKAWEQVGTLDAEGKPVPIDCTPDNIELLVAKSGIGFKVRRLVMEVNQRIADEVEAAGNA
jgi:hypothetical protein